VFSPFLTSALDGRRVVRFKPRPLYSRGKNPDSHSLGVSVGPKAGLTLWSREKSLVSAGNLTPALQPVTRPHTN
jgi:hypothetical protein